VEVEDGLAVQRADQVERGLARAVGGRPSVGALRRVDRVALAAPGDDPHRRRTAGRRRSRSYGAPGRRLRPDRRPRELGEERRVDDVGGDLSGQLEERPVGTETGELQVREACLARPEELTLAPDLEVALGQL